jgi:glycosyltransferase involved in cell wall biosynthesis
MTAHVLLPITCFIRTLNEERRIGAVIAAARQLCDEVLLIDSGSSDQTVMIAESLGARVVHQPWLGNGLQKRVGEEQARNCWLLDLDADEVLSGELMEEIRRIFDEGPAYSVYRLPLKIVDPAGRLWERSGLSYRAKLYDRQVVRMPAERAWDQLSVPSDVPMRRLSGPLYHFAFSDLGQLARKQEAAMRNRITGMSPRPRWETGIRLVFAFPLYFLKYYLFRGLWRVGLYGFCFSCVCAFSRWLRDVKLYERDWLPRRTDGTVVSGDPQPRVQSPRAAA